MNHREDMNVACVASMCVHVHVHAQSLSHLAGMAMLQVWSLVGRWHSQCGVSGSKIDSRTLTNVNQQYLTVYNQIAHRSAEDFGPYLSCISRMTS